MYKLIIQTSIVGFRVVLLFIIIIIILVYLSVTKKILNFIQ